MNKAFEFIRSLWISAQLGTPYSLQRAVIPRLHEANEIARLLARPRLPVYEIQGQGQGGPIAVTYIGLGYAKPFLMSLLSVEPVERQVGRIPFWHPDELVDMPSSDIVGSTMGRIDRAADFEATTGSI